MSLANQRGSFHKKLFIARNGHNESRCVLKHVFLKKTENYALQITDFFINKSPTIFRNEEEVLFEIMQYNGIGANPNTWQGHILESDRQFKAKRCYSVPELIRQATIFLHKFGFKIQALGYAYHIVDALDNLVLSANLPGFEVENVFDPIPQANFIQVNYQNEALLDFGYGAYPNQGRIAKMDITKDNVVRIHYEADFARNFYINLSEKMRQRFDFTDRQLQSPGKQIFIANNTIAHLDERVSIDVVGTLHASSKISVLNSVEGREYVLGRFPLAQADEFKTKSYYTSGGDLQEATTIVSSYPLGLQNLTRFNPNYESNHLLNGDIAEINIELRTRYLEDGKFVSTPMECEDAFWSLVLLFSKKV